MISLIYNMKTLKQRIWPVLAVVAALVWAAFPAHGALSASQLLERCADKLREAPSVSARFTLSAPDGSRADGDILLSRERFRLTTQGLRIWFDGRTQWTAYAATREVSITEPTAEELLTGNPFAIITGYAGKYACRLLPGSGAVRDVELTPHSAGGDIRKAVLSVDTRTLWPVRAVVTLSSGATVSAAIRDCATGGKPAASVFAFAASALPGYEIVDLR